MTNYYDLNDMQEPARGFYAYGIDRVNEEIRRLAKEENVSLLNIAKDLADKQELVDNRWHFNAKGSQTHVNIIASYLRNRGLSQVPTLRDRGTIGDDNRLRS